MNEERAAEILNGMAYKPGYRVRAVATGTYEVAMILIMDTYDSTPRAGGYQPPATITSPTVYIDTEHLDKLGVMGAAMQAIIQVETHEAREFLRDGQGGPAPFHPHNRSGETAFKLVSKLPVQVRYPEPR